MPQTRFLAAALAAALLLLSGCATHTREEAALKVAPYQPLNIAQTGKKLPKDVVRVVVLPVWYHESWPFLDELDRTIADELSKTGLFEVVLLDRRAMKKIFGQPQYSSTGLLPGNFAAALKSKLAVDAVLLSDLTLYEPYRPVAVGLRMKLLDLHRMNVIWAIDSVYNSGNPGVISGARQYTMDRQTKPYPLDRGLMVMRSPSMFSRYAIWQSFQALPPRALPKFTAEQNSALVPLE